MDEVLLLVLDIQDVLGDCGVHRQLEHPDVNTIDQILLKLHSCDHDLSTLINTESGSVDYVQAASLRELHGLLGLLVVEWEEKLWNELGSDGGVCRTGRPRKAINIPLVSMLNPCS